MTATRVVRLALVQRIHARLKNSPNANRVGNVPVIGTQAERMPNEATQISRDKNAVLLVAETTGNSLRCLLEQQLGWGGVLA